jgi:hypothetical protein
MSRCLFCGELLNEEGKCPNAAQHFKPMCFNCLHMGIDGEDCVCCNEDNKNDAIQKIISSFDGGYQITGVTLKPLPLKDPTKKCKRHTLNYDVLIEGIKSLV